MSIESISQFSRDRSIVNRLNQGKDNLVARLGQGNDHLHQLITAGYAKDQSGGSVMIIVEAVEFTINS